jgi:integrase
MSDPLTVADVIALYRAHCKADDVHGIPAKKERDFVFPLFLEVCGHLPLGECKPFHLVDFITANSDHWKSVATKRQKANCIKAAFQWATDEERILRNPFRSIKYGEAERRPAMPDADVETVLQAANKPTERILRFLRLTGCRVGEVCRARWCDIDIDRGILTIRQHKSKRKTGKAKVIALVPDVIDLLRTIAELMPPGTSDDSPIFLNTRGRPWTRRCVWGAIQRFAANCGIEGHYGPHSLRHTFATVAVANGAPVALVAAQLGHASSKVTERYYVDLSNSIDAIRGAAILSMPKPMPQPKRGRNAHRPARAGIVM